MGDAVVEPTTFIITKKDMDNCLIHSMSVTHYYPNGSCRCWDEPPPTPIEETVGGDPVLAEEEPVEAPPDGAVWVEGYTRSDGVEVGGYWRNT